jgi:hypothetical protein
MVELPQYSDTVKCQEAKKEREQGFKDNLN